MYSNIREKINQNNKAYCWRNGLQKIGGCFGEKSVQKKLANEVVDQSASCECRNLEAMPSICCII
jgi:hypothetical protein